MKKLLVSAIGGVIADAGVQPVVIVVVKIVGDAGLRVGQVGKHGPLAEFEHLRFEPGPEAFGLSVVVAIPAAALRTEGLMVVEQLAIGVAAVLPAAVGVHNKPGRGRLGKKAPLQGRGDQLFGHGGGHVPAHDVLAARVLEGAQIGPMAVGER